MPVRIWHQSITDLERLPGYRSMLGDHARRVGDAETHVDLHGVAPGTYPEGMAPIELARYPWPQYLANVQIVENALRAEHENYDAVAISCFLDPGLEEARSVVDIPVVSTCETALLVASTVGRAFGLLGLEESNARALTALVHRYGFEDRLAAAIAMDPPVTEHELDRSYTDGAELTERFIANARRLADAGADVIIPAEGVLNTVLVRNDVREVDGIPVLDAYGALISFAEMLVRLRSTTGLRVGRRFAYARPPAHLLDHMRTVTADALRARSAATP